MNKLSSDCFSKGSFSLGGMNKLSFNSITFSGLILGDFNISNFSKFCIKLSCLITPSTIILSTFWFFNSSFSFGAIKRLSIGSISFSFLFEVFNTSITSIFCISFSGLFIASINNSSHIFNSKGSLSSGSNNKLSIPCIKFSGLGDFKIINLSIFWISLSGL